MDTLADTLHAFRAAVEDYRKRSPHLDAYAEMQAVADEADRVLGPHAAALWERVLTDAPGDPLAEHHLAIIRHGTGYRLHATSPHEAVGEWKRGAQHWARVVNDDAFWDSLRRTWEDRVARAKGADPIGERLLKLDLRRVRAHLPRPLLALHAGLAEDCAAADPELAALHVGAIKESGFPAAAVEKARKRVYDSVAGDVVKLAEGFNGDEAWVRIRRFLAIDSDYPPALADALRLCAGECERKGADPARLEPLLVLLREASAWAVHPALVEAARTRFALAQARADFYLAWAELCCNHGIEQCNDGKAEAGMRLMGQAFEQIGLCLEATPHPSPDAANVFHRVCVQGAIGDIMRNRAKRSFPLADRMLKAGLAREPNDPMMHAVHAWAYHVSGDKTEFRKTLARAEALQSQSPTSEANALLSELRQLAERG